MTDASPLHHVFISYNLLDRTWVREFLLPALRAAGLSAIDRDDFEIGVPELVNMERAVDRTRRTLVILTPAWVEDQSADFVSLLTQTKGVASREPKLLPLLLEPCVLPERIEMLTKADFTDPQRQEEELQRLVDTLRASAAEPPLPASTAPPARPAHRIPSPVADFIGRTADVEALVEHLTSATVAIAGIRGMGGIGKTQLALAVAQHLDDAFPDQLMFELQSGAVPLTPEALLGRVIHAFQPELKLPNELEELQALYRSLLAGRRGLLLFDNAASGQQMRPLLPPPAGWAVIVTSRSRFRLEGGKLHDVELLSLEDATALLARMLSDGERHDLDGADLRPLAERCGRLPLALRLAAAYLTSASSRTLESYLDALERARLRYLKDPEDERTVRTVLGLSVERLGVEAGGALARRWRDLAVFPAPFDVAAAAAVWAIGEEDTQDALDALRQRSLVEHEAGSYSLHDLLREIALEEPPTDEVYYRHANHYLALGSAANALYRGSQAVAGLLAFDSVLPHLRAAHGWIRERTAREAQQWLNDFPSRTANVLDLRVNASETIGFRQAAFEAAQKMEDRRGEGDHLGNLGNAFGNLGRVEQAIECHSRALAISREIGDRRGEADWLGSLGIACRKLGRAEQAIEYCEQALAISREIGDRRREAYWLGHLGNAYEALERAEQASESYQQALEISREIKDRRGEGDSLGNLGNASYALGRIEQAIKYHTQSLAISREMGDRRGESADLGNLGSAYAALGRAEQAIEYHQQALAISREIQDRYAEGNHLGNLGGACAALGRAGQAIAYYQRALEISREIRDRRGEANHCWSLGMQYERAGELQRAAELMQVCVDYEIEIGHPDAQADAETVAEIRRQAAEEPSDPQDYS